jgi:signal transduction histidine kinase
VGNYWLMDAHEQGAAWPAWVPQVSALVAIGLALLTPFAHFEGERSIGLYVLLGLAVLPWLAWLARKPLHPAILGVWTAAPIMALNWAGEAFGLDSQHDAQLSMMLLIWAVGCVAATTPSVVSLPFGGAAALVPIGRAVFFPGFEPWVFWLAGTLLAVITGTAIRRQQVLLAELRAAQSALADEATRQERRRIAREVHDAIAHSLTVTMLHLSAARMALKRDTHEAEEAIHEAERLGRLALDDVRRTVGLLHDDGRSATDAALPNATDITSLVDSYTAAGMPVRVDCAVDLNELSPARGLAVYRAVQEALANTAKHAPGAQVRVSIAHDGDRLVLEVADTGGEPAGPTDGRGLGLRGMRERIEALGGSVTAERRNGGWVTSCVIPTEAAP